MNKIIDLIIIGAGNLDIVRLVEDINDFKKTFNLIGFLEKDQLLHGKSALGYPILGDESLLITKLKNVSIVNNVMATTYAHEQILINMAKLGINNYPNLIHPSVNMKYVKLGQGNIIYECIHFGTEVNIGNFNIFYPGSKVGHQATIGDYCLFAADAIASARTKIGNRVFLGNKSLIIPGKYICDDAFIGAGSVVTRSIKSKMTVFGVPAVKID